MVLTCQKTSRVRGLCGEAWRTWKEGKFVFFRCVLMLVSLLSKNRGMVSRPKLLMLNCVHTFFLHFQYKHYKLGCSIYSVYLTGKRFVENDSF
jgi:hypothetical protein